MRITAECAACAWRYDATQGLECPHCHGTGIRWAFREPDDDPYAVVDRLRAVAQQEWYIPEAIETPDMNCRDWDEPLFEEYMAELANPSDFDKAHARGMGILLD